MVIRGLASYGLGVELEVGSVTKHRAFELIEGWSKHQPTSEFDHVPFSLLYNPPPREN